MSRAAPRPGLVDRVERVRSGVELDIDKPHVMRRRPRRGVFQGQLAPDIDADAIVQTHRKSPAGNATSYHPIRPIATAPRRPGADASDSRFPDGDG